MIYIAFILGLTSGLVAGLILFYIIFKDDFKAVEEFNKRQERYQRMV